MRRKRLIIKKKDAINLSKKIFFIGIILLPFINITNIIGMEVFLDSFENSESYVFLKNDNLLSATDTSDSSYIVIQRTDHPDFEIRTNDKIMYSTYQGDISCNKVEEIENIGTYEIVHINKDTNNDNSNVVYKNQIIGKVITIVDENILNSISLKTWSIAIENMNINSIID